MIFAPADDTLWGKEGFAMKITYDMPRSAPESGIGPWIRRALLVWLFAVTAEYLYLNKELRDLTVLDGIGEISPVRLAALALVAAGGLYALRKALTPERERMLLAAVFTVTAMSALTVSFTWPFFVACLLVQAMVLVYALWGWNDEPRRGAVRCREDKGFLVVTVAAAGLFFLIVSAWTVCRVLSFSTPTFDFGIFAQMFHSMKTRGLPITTVERDGPLSHFAVHVSPIYYLLLPFYYLAPQPATLQVLQAAVLASAVIPLWLLGKHHNLKPMARCILCLLLLLYPAYAGGTSYDIHENAFLTPLLLWLFYGIDRKNGAVTAIAAVLTLMVKEDAAVYVAVVALYLLLRSALSADKKWGLVTGSVMLGGALLWFAVVTGYLSIFGDGVMTYRYDNFMYDDSGSLITVIKAVLLRPMKAVFECVDQQKLKFIGLTMGALAFLPLMTRRYERLILLIPYLLVNLMTDYQYQYDIFFQYTYGSTACLIYMVLVNAVDFKKNLRRMLALELAMCISLGCFVAQIMPKASRYPEYCKTYAGYYEQLREVLDVIPEDASVAATTYYTTYLSQRDVLYDVRYGSRAHVLSCEYMAVGVTDKTGLKTYAVNGERGYENFVELLLAEGYVKIAEYEGKLEIYHKEN